MGKLLAIAVAIGQSIYGKWLIQRLIAGVILLSSLIIVTCIMVCALLIGGLYAAYLALLHSGVASGLAMAMLGGTLLLVILILIVTTIWYLNRLRTIPRRIITEKIPAVSEAVASANEMFDAFLEGLMGTPEGESAPLK